MHLIQEVDGLGDVGHKGDAAGSAAVEDPSVELVLQALWGCHAQCHLRTHTGSLTTGSVITRHYSSRGGCIFETIAFYFTLL